MIDRFSRDELNYELDCKFAKSSFPTQDDPTTFNGGLLSNVVSIPADDVINTKRIESESDLLPTTVSFRYPDDVIDCDGLVVPQTAFGQFDCSVIKSNIIYGIAHQRGESSFFGLDVGHGVLGRVQGSNEVLCVPIGIHSVNGTIYRASHGELTKLSMDGKALVKALIEAKIDGEKLTKALKSMGYHVNSYDKFEACFIGGYRLNGFPIIIQTLLGYLEKNQ